MNTIVFNRKHYCFFTLNSYKSWRRSRRLPTLPAITTKHSFSIGHDTGKLREFHVIADQHADPGAIRVKRLHHLPARESPALPLVRGDMYLLVHLVGAVTTDQVSHVIQRPALLPYLTYSMYNFKIVTELGGKL